MEHQISRDFLRRRPAPKSSVFVVVDRPQFVLPQKHVSPGGATESSPRRKPWVIMAQQVVQAPVGAKEDSVGYRWFPVSSQLIESLRFRFRHWTGCNCTFRPSGTTVVSFDRVPWLAPWARFLSPSGARRQKKTWMKPFACQSQLFNNPGQLCRAGTALRSFRPTGLLPERPGGCCAQKVPAPFSLHKAPQIDASASDPGSPMLRIGIGAIPNCRAPGASKTSCPSRFKICEFVMSWAMLSCSSSFTCLKTESHCCLSASPPRNKCRLWFICIRWP